MDGPIGYVISKLINNDIFYLAEILKEGEEQRSLYADFNRPSNISACLVWVPALETAMDFGDEQIAEECIERYVRDDCVIEPYYDHDLDLELEGFY